MAMFVYFDLQRSQTYAICPTDAEIRSRDFKDQMKDRLLVLLLVAMLVALSCRRDSVYNDENAQVCQSSFVAYDQRPDY